MYRVFSRASYVVLAIMIALSTYCALVFIQYSALILAIVRNDTSMLSEKFALLLSVFSSPARNFIEEPTTTLLPLLFGINITLLIFYRQLFKSTSAISTSGGVIGSVIAFFGIGCAACGSLFLTTLSASSVGLVALLPFQGAELGYLGLALLTLSSFLLVRAINKPVVCTI